MRRSTFSTLKRRGPAMFLSAILLAAGAQAAELSDPQVHSYLGQPLSADIELVSINADEAATLQVRLASPDVYRGANVAMPPALQGLTMTIVRRDQRQFLHITSFKPVEAGHLVLFVELWGGGRNTVREATILLAPDPHPVPLPPPYIPPPPVPPSPAAAPMTPAAPPVAMPAPVADAALVAALARAAMPHPASAPPVHAELPHPLAHPLAHASAELHAPAEAAAAVAAEHGAAVRPEPVVVPAPASAFKPAAKAVVHSPAEPVAKVEDSKAYIALDKKNAVLTKKLTELEGKIRQLQEQVGAKPASGAMLAVRPAAGGPIAANAAPGGPPVAKPLPVDPLVKPAPRPLLHKLKSLKAMPAEKKPAETGISPLLWLGVGTAALLLVIGLGVFLYQRRRRRKGDGAASKVGILLRKPFQRKKAVPDQTAAIVEEALTEPGHVE